MTPVASVTVSTPSPVAGGSTTQVVANEVGQVLGGFLSTLPMPIVNTVNNVSLATMEVFRFLNTPVGQLAATNMIRDAEAVGTAMGKAIGGIVHGFKSIFHTGSGA